MKIDRGFENYKLVHNNFTFHKRDLNKFKNIFLKADSVEVDILNGLSFVLSLIIRTPEFLDLKKYFPKYILFENNYESISTEVLNFINNKNIKSFVKTGNTYSNEGIGKKQEDNFNIQDANSWRLFALKEFSDYSPEIVNFPSLKYILDDLNLDIINCFISILEPNTHIPIHHGYFKGVMRLMFAIKVPKDKDNCFLWVNGKEYSWEEGKCVLWDDIYPHKVYNNTDETRIVLYMDVLRLPKRNFIKKYVYMGLEYALSLPRFKSAKSKYIKETEIIKYNVEN